jgi:pyridoxal biosynthesis lyase PdxS
MATAAKKKKRTTTVRKKTTTAHKKSTRKKTAKKKAAPKKWSHRVMETSDALDLQSGIFKSKDPKKIAQSLKRSAEKSKRRKGTPYQSAMSMLNFYINRAGKHLTAKEKQPLEKAKPELRKLFGREE